MEHLLRIKNVGTTSTHFLAILPNGEYICDCCMGINLGVPCRHYFQVLLKMLTLQFHIGLVRPRYVKLLDSTNTGLTVNLVAFRWYQNLDLDPSTIQPTPLENIQQQKHQGEIDFMKPVTVPMSNPLDTPRMEARTTDTLPARTVFHQTQAAVRSLTNHIQTQGEMDDLLEKISDLW